MKSNIIAFRGSTVARSTNAKSMIQTNVVAMSAWKKAFHPLRTPQGVFLVTNVLCTTGDIA
ncbi:hypothetical protein O2N63_11135 [Aliiroseovarius sp. KMU-50]|uniref:Uncharacterized protein n=1 Tax=Aliiroseovarius salicola TaxID=3009082 RepID=A0ABT4W4H7_9RHOB|nr:hypothetical protein [Aliiroseovarius sp. KMU-50]MDA5094638.1 hypothetical protein [Aliiroseovarius sp. KMU-50]